MSDTEQSEEHGEIESDAAAQESPEKKLSAANVKIVSDEVFEDVIVRARKCGIHSVESLGSREQAAKIWSDPDAAYARKFKRKASKIVYAKGRRPAHKNERATVKHGGCILPASTYAGCRGLGARAEMCIEPDRDGSGRRYGMGFQRREDPTQGARPHRG